MLHQPTEGEREQIVKTVFGDNHAENANSHLFETYFKYYCSIVCPASVGNAVIEVDTPALKSHADILGCVRTIIQDPKVSFNAFVARTVKPKSPEASLREKEYIARVTTEVLIGINSTFTPYHWDASLGTNARHVGWEGDTSFLSFIENAFKPETPCGQAFEQQQRLAETVLHKKTLKAWKLNQRYGIEIMGTNNLLEHLMLDPNTRTLKVFHQVSFLRAHLEKSLDEPLDLSFEESLRKGTLPPRLLLETLLTFHDVLFPVTSIKDTKSIDALKTMIKKHDFDPEVRWIEFVRTTPPDMNFDFWGERLSKLYDVVKPPPPANAIVAWFERHTSERNALTVAIIGVFLSVLFGSLSFIVGLLQLILAWFVYKNPPECSR